MFHQKIQLETACTYCIMYMIDSFPTRRTRTVFGPNGVADLCFDGKTHTYNDTPTGAADL